MAALAEVVDQLLNGELQAELIDQRRKQRPFVGVPLFIEFQESADVSGHATVTGPASLVLLRQCRIQ